MTSSVGGGGNWPFERVRGESSTPLGGGAVGRAGQTPERPVAPAGFAGPSTPTSPTTPEHASGPTPAGHGSGRGRGGGAGGGRPGRRRPPVWLLVVIGLVVVGAVVAAILLLTRDEADPPADVPEAETVTLPVPTPTVEPIAREAGTAFQDSIPSVVLDHVVKEIGEHEPLLLAGAIEAWRFTYTDGATDAVLYAGQFRDAAAAEAAFDQVLAANPVPAPADDAAEPTEPAEPTEGATATPAEPAPEPEQGVVEVDGQQVGRFFFLPREDGTASLWWTNTTVLLHLDGTPKAVRDLYAAFPL